MYRNFVKNYIFKGISALVVCLHLVSSISWAYPNTYKTVDALAVESIFQPIREVVGSFYLNQAKLEVRGIIAMALRGTKGKVRDRNDYLSHLNINSALDKRCSNRKDKLFSRIFEVTDLPYEVERGPDKGAVVINMKLRYFSPEKGLRFRVIFKGKRLDDMMDPNKISIEKYSASDKIFSGKHRTEDDAIAIDSHGFRPLGIDSDDYETFDNAVNEYGSAENDFVRYTAVPVEEWVPEYAVLNSKEDVYAFFGIKEDDAVEGRLKLDIADIYDTVNSSAEALVARAFVNGSEFVWFCSRVNRPEIIRPEYGAAYYMDGKRIAHGFSTRRGDEIYVRAGLDDKSLRHTEVPKILYHIKEYVLRQVYNPSVLIAHNYQMTSWEVLFFYVKRGYLPLNEHARDLIIDKFARHFMKDESYSIEDPEKEFGIGIEEFAELCGYFIRVMRNSEIRRFDGKMPEGVGYNLRSRPEMPEEKPFYDLHPVEIFKTEDAEDSADIADKRSLVDRIIRNMYYAEAPNDRKLLLEDRIFALMDIIPNLKTYLSDKYKKLDIINMSVFGSYPYIDEELQANDIDFLVTVKGNHFLSDEISIADFIASGFKKTDVEKLNIMIVGEENLNQGLVDNDSEFSEHWQKRFIGNTVSTLYRRNIVFAGPDFSRVEHGPEIDVFGPVVDDMLLTSYQRLYNFKSRGPENDEMRMQKIITRLYDASLLLRRIEPDSSIEPEDLYTMRLKYVKREIGFREVEEAWIRVRDEYRRIKEQKLNPVISDINKHGLIVHGMKQIKRETSDNRKKRLIYLFNEGLKPWDEIPEEYRPKDPSGVMYPEKISLSMVAHGSGYERTTCATANYGPNQKEKYALDYPCNITFVLDPAYVRAHPDKFKAVGYFFEDKKVSDDFTYRRDMIEYGIEYKKVERSAVFGMEIKPDIDELEADSIPPEAIGALIAHDDYAKELAGIIQREFPQKSIRIYNPWGGLLYDIKGREIEMNEKGIDSSGLLVHGFVQPNGEDKQARRKRVGYILGEGLKAWQDIPDEIRVKGVEGAMFPDKVSMSMVEETNGYDCTTACFGKYAPTDEDESMRMSRVFLGNILLPL